MFFPDEKKQRDERNEATKKSWLRTELLQSDLVAPDPGASIIARWMYAYNEIAFAVNQWYAFQPTLWECSESAFALLYCFEWVCD